MRRKVSKIAMFMLVLCMTISMFAVNVSAADETTAIDNCTRVVEAYDLDDAQDYIDDGDTSTYPTKDGYVFAGWYTDEACGKDSYWGEQEPGDTVYALFVPSHVLSVKAQISGNLLDGDTGNDGTASIRFVTTVDTLYYRQAGFTVSYVNAEGTAKNVTSASNKVYKKLYAIGATATEDASDDVEYTEENILKYTPEGTFCGLSTYFKACTVKNVSSDYYTTPFTVTPFWKTMDGSIVYGETVIKSINDYFLEDEVWVSSTDANAADTVENGSEDKPFATLNYALGMVKNEGIIHVKDSYTAPSDFVWKDHDKTVTITGGTMDFTGVPTLTIKEVATTALQINDSVKFTGTTLKFVDGQHIYANGNKVEIASDVTWGDTSAYVWIYGGAYNTTLKSDTNLVLSAGYYERVFGGGNYGTLNGNTNVTLSGSINTGITYSDHSSTYMAFGAGENGSKLNGDANLTIASENVLFNYVYGGGYGSNVTGDCRVNYSGKAMSVYGGGRNGYVTGDTYLVMSGENAWVEQLFGGCQGSAMTGNTNIDVQDGTVVRRVYGGCYNDTEGTFSLSFKTTYCVTGHTNVTISPNATFSLNYTDSGLKVDNSIYAISRGASAFTNEWSAFIFNADSYTNTYKSKLGYSGDVYSSAFATQTHHYLITTNGNTADGSYGTVSSAGDYIRIKPNSGYSATVTVEGTQEYYTESEGVFQLPTLTNTTDTRSIVVTFGTIDSSVDKSGYEAKIDGAYYDTLEEAVDAAHVLDKEDVVTITLLKDAEVEETMVITDSANIEVEGADKYTINRADSLVNGSIFNVKEGSTLTVDNVVLDGRTSSELAAGTTDLDALTGSTASLIYNAGTTNLQNMTGQYAVKTATHGAVLQSGGSTDVVTVDNSTFSYNKAPGQGAAIRMGGNTAKLEVANSTFEYNEVYTLTTTADDGTVSVSATGNGGAIGTHADVATIDNCTFIGNTATGYSANNDGSAGAVYSGTYSVVTMTGTDENALFSGNSVTNGAGGAVSAGSGKVTITGYTFKSNTSTGNGGAIFSNGGSTKIKSVSCTFEGNTATGNGGVAYAGSSGTLIFDKDEECAVEALAKNNKAGGNGGATAQGGNTVVKVTGYTFEENTAKQGGAIRVNSDALSATVKDAKFVSNSASEGGAVYNAGSLTMIGTGSTNALFNANSSTGNGGAIYLAGKAEITGYKFDGNKATGYNGGAICNYSNGSQVLDCQFTNNEAKQGGAVYSGGNANTLTFGVTETPVLTAKFEGNKSTGYGGAIGFGNGNLNVTGYSFTGNDSATYGGAIYTVGNNNTINITDATFTSNNAKNGGAISTHGYKASTTVTGSTFTGNIADEVAGAVNVAEATATVTIDDSTFGTNDAKNGGAIYNKGALTVTDSALSSNTSTEYAGALFIDESTVKVESTSFTSNQSAEGGAIIVGRIEEIAATETTEAITNYYVGTLNATDCTFSTNKATTGVGGAILNISGSTANITDTTFTSNESVGEGGAVSNSGTLTLEGTGKGTALFDGNGIVDDAGKNGAAIYNGGTLTVTAYVFEENTTTANGGAVCNYGKKPRFIDCQFIRNSANIGGAIYNGGGNTIYLEVSEEPVLDALCDGNIATYRGGAVGSGYGHNYIDGYEFKNNHAGYGGAVYLQNVLDANSKAAYSKISNCNFTDNYNEATSKTTSNHGGALQVDGGKIDIETCEFNSNEAVEAAGAVYFPNANVTATVKDTTFDGNTSGTEGGAIYSGNATITLINGTFTNNETNAENGGAGGALRLVAGNTTIVNTQFSDNSAKGYGGAISASNQGVLTISATSEELGVTTATKAKFENNTSNGVHATDMAYGGGAIYFGSGTFSLSGYEFTGNTAAGDAGALCCRVATTISDCTFKNNTATGAGGAIAKLNAQNYVDCKFEGNTAGGEGGAIYSYTATVSTSNTSFTDNSAVTGGAIYQTTTAAVTLEDSTFETNKATTEAGAVYVGKATLTASNTDFTGNEAAVGGAISVGIATVTTETTTGEDGTETTEEVTTYTDGTLDVDNCNFASNKAIGGSGGAIHLVSGTVTLDATDDSAFTSNQAQVTHGGAVYIGNGSVTANDYAFNQNTSYQDGGAIYNDGATFTALDCTFDSNTATATSGNATNTGGGAVYNAGGAMTLTRDVFTRNHSGTIGGAVCNYNKATTLTDCTFGGTGTVDADGDGKLDTLGNTAATNGGAFYSGGGVTATFTTGTNAEMAYFEGNSSLGTDENYGGAIGMGSGTLDVTGYTFTSNHSAEYGGAIGIKSAGTISQCTFNGNDADTSGGALWTNKSPTVKSCVFKSNWADSQGGAVYTNGGKPTFTDCQFGGVNDTDANKAVSGGAVYQGGGSSSVTFTVSDNPTVDALFQNNETTSTSGYGGGAICLGNGNLNVYGYEFKENYSMKHGGAIHNNSGSNTIYIYNSKFDANNAATYGGAIRASGTVYIYQDSTQPGNKSTEFTGNYAASCGAIFNSGGTLTVSGYAFKSNYTNTTSTSSNGEGGAIYSNGTMSLEECSFDSNTATRNGGAVLNSKNATFTDCSFTSNTTTKYYGGAIYNIGGTLTVTNGEFISNQAASYGGAVYMNGTATASFTGTGAFTSNISSAFGGAIYSKSTAENGLTVDGYTFTGNKGTFGGAIMLYEAAAKATVSNCTFDQNEATSNEGGAVYINNSGIEMTITDCIFTNNKAAKTGGAVTIGSGVMTINTTDGFTGALFQGNSTTSNDKGGAIFLYAGTLNISGYTFTDNTPQDIYINTAKSPTLNGDGNYTTN